MAVTAIIMIFKRDRFRKLKMIDSWNATAHSPARQTVQKPSILLKTLYNYI
mgnify:CR=1 FL=1